MSATSDGTSRAGAALYVALCAVAFVATSWFLRDRLPGGTQHERTEVKFEYFREHRDEYTVLFFGSSRVFRGFDPEVFDRTAAAAGVTTHAFNFGIPGSHAIEIQHMIARLGPLAPKRIDFVLIDTEGLNIPSLHRNFHSRSVIDWHDVEMTRLIASYVLSEPYSPWQKATLVCEHVGSCVYNLANVGRALGWVDPWLGSTPNAEFIAKTLGPLGNGYCADFSDEGQRSKRDLRFQRKGLNDYLTQLEAFRAKKPSGEPPRATSLTLYRRMSRMVRELGARPIFVTLPALYLQDDLLSAHAAGDVEDLLPYHDAELYPQLYAPENREDQTHLNPDGARLFSEKLARDFVELVKRAEPRQ